MTRAYSISGTTVTCVRREDDHLKMSIRSTILLCLVRHLLVLKTYYCVFVSRSRYNTRERCLTWLVLELMMYCSSPSFIYVLLRRISVSVLPLTLNTTVFGGRPDRDLGYCIFPRSRSGCRSRSYSVQVRPKLYLCGERLWSISKCLLSFIFQKYLWTRKERVL